MLELLKKNYPSAEIWCLTLPVSRCDSDKNFVFSFSIGGRHIERYNEVIREAAAEYGCRLIELYDPSSPHDTIDGFHPTADGMRAIADRVIMNIEDTV
jgi:lysophospholipase L1-like esterase